MSYTTSNITIPALQSLPNASAAASALKEVQLRTRKHVLTLAHVTAFSLATAFTLSSPRRKHPYLIWTGIVTLIGGTGIDCWFNGLPSLNFMTTICGGFRGVSCSGFGFGTGSSVSGRLNNNNNNKTTEAKTDEDESSANGSEIEIVENADTESSAHAATPPSTVTPDESDINGESVKREMEQERKVQRIRSWILGLGFSMGVVGIWGDRA